MKDMELEEMRAQINLLKEKLEKQGIVNSHLLQQSMKAKVSQIHRQGWKGVACGLVAIVAFTFNYIMGSLSLPFVIASILLMLFCIIGTWHCHMPLNDKDLMEQDIHTTARAFSLVKRRYNFWLHYITPTLTIPWILWFCHDFIHTSNIPREFAKPTMIAFCISACIGGLIGYMWHRKVVNACDEPVKQLEDV